MQVELAALGYSQSTEHEQALLSWGQSTLRWVETLQTEPELISAAWLRWGFQPGVNTEYPMALFVLSTSQVTLPALLSLQLSQTTPILGIPTTAQLGSCSSWEGQSLALARA